MHRVRWRNDTDREKTKREKNQSFGILYTTNPHWTGLGSKSGLCRSVLDITEGKVITVRKHDGMRA
jgi:hypothetical protein